MESRSPILKTVIMCCTVFMSGVLVGIMGPSLPDLRCIYAVDLTTVNFTLLSLGLGALCGQLVSPLMLRKLSVNVYLACLTSLMCVFFSAFTVFGVYAGLVLLFCGAASAGSAFNVTLIEAAKLWPGNLRMVYIMFACVSGGAVIGPLVLIPFVSDGIIAQSYTPLTNHTLLIHHTFDNSTLCSNSTEILEASQSADCDRFISFIRYPYIMFGAVDLCLTLMYIYISIREKPSIEYAPYEELEKTVKNKNVKLAFIAFMMIVCVEIQGLPSGFSSLMSTFGVQSDLQLSLSTMTSMTSVFWFCFLVGRVSLGFVPNHVRQVKILVTCLCGTIVGFIILCFALSSEIVLLVAAGVIGVSSAGIGPASLAYIREWMPLTPAITTACLTATAMGYVVPFIAGIVVTALGQQTFSYFFLGLNIIGDISFLVAYVLSKYLK